MAWVLRVDKESVRERDLARLRAYAASVTRMPGACRLAGLPLL